MNKKLTLLLADDEPRNIFALKAVLTLKGYRVLTAQDGNECLHMLQQYPETDAVLLDMMMPEKDGYETLQEIRQDSRFRTLPVIAVTAQAMPGDREKCLQAGATAYVSKPIDEEQLVQVLQKYMD